jgi:hypothetical protein
MSRWSLFLTACASCATAGDDFEAQPGRKPDAAASETSIDAAADSAAIFPTEDSSAEMETSTDTGMVAADTAPADTGPMTTTLAIDTTECKAIACPASHPYIVGCKVVVGGDSGQVCIVATAASMSVTFKEGQSCGGETVKGSITCSTAMGTGLDATNCTTNKTKPLYIASIGSCPT